MAYIATAKKCPISVSGSGVNLWRIKCIAHRLYEGRSINNESWDFSQFLNKFGKSCCYVHSVGTIDFHNTQHRIS